METRKGRNKLFVPPLIILGLMVFMVLYTATSSMTRVDRKSVV